jgi:hypothetical protein
MRIPLIVSARVQEETQFPRVILKSGKWRFESDSKDSELLIKTPTKTLELHDELHLTEHTPVSLACVKAGTEQFITVYACLST